MTPPPKPSPPTSARLFGEADRATPSGVYTAHIDGASRGNPGPASYAVVVRDPAGKVIFELGKKFGRDTNNVAEYYGLLAALDYAANHGISSLRIRSDSELLVRQMQGRYKVKSPDLKPLHERAARLSRQLSYFAIEHVPREMNRDADALANAALDSADATAGSAPSKPRVTPSPNPAATPQGATPTSSRRLRARVTDGVLVPWEPLELAEGTEVILDLRIENKL